MKILLLLLFTFTYKNTKICLHSQHYRVRYVVQILALQIAGFVFLSHLPKAFCASVS